MREGGFKGSYDDTKVLKLGLEGIAMCSACRMRERQSFALSCNSFWDEDQSFVNAHPS